MSTSSREESSQLDAPEDVSARTLWPRDADRTMVDSSVGGILADRCDMSGCHPYPLLEVARRSRRNASVPASPTEQKRVMEPGSGRATSPALRAPREATGSW